MQEPTDNSQMQSHTPDQESPVGNHPADPVQPGSVGENAGVDANPTTSADITDTPLSNDLPSAAKSVDSLDSAVAFTPMLDLVRSSQEPWRMFFCQLQPGKDFCERRTINPAAVTFKRVSDTAQDELWVEMEKLPRRLVQSLVLPRDVQGYGSTGELLESIVAFLRSHTPLAEKDCSLVAYWAIGTWFLDFLPFLPSLVVTGPPLAADRLLRTLAAVCRRPLALADLSSAVLLTLPLNGLKPTLLIRKPQLNRRLAALLDASNQPGYWACGGGNFNDLLERRQAEPLPQLGVDEKAFRKGHKYFTLVNDLERSRVLYVAEDRTQASLDGFWQTLTEGQRESIEAIAMDMWDPYVASVREHLREGRQKIVYDKFHIAKHLGNAVDKVRRQENRTLRAAGDDRLTGTRYDWLRNPTAMEPADRKAFAALRQSGLKTARAWALKETGMAILPSAYTSVSTSAAPS